VDDTEAHSATSRDAERRAVQGDAVQTEAHSATSRDAERRAVQGDAVQGDTAQGDTAQGDTAQGDAGDGAGAVRVLQRWVDSGGVLKVVGSFGGAVTVAMMTCTAGEEVDRLSSADPAVAAWLEENDPVR
jgi:hypothetical protein